MTIAYILQGQRNLGIEKKVANDYKYSLVLLLPIITSVHLQCGLNATGTRSS